MPNFEVSYQNDLEKWCSMRPFLSGCGPEMSSEGFN